MVPLGTPFRSSSPCAASGYNSAKVISVWRELQLSAKWTAILFVPALLAAFILSALAGGIEGDGKALLLIAGAPVFWFALHFPKAYDFSPITWLIFLEALYFYVLVLLFRLSHLQVPLRFLGRHLVRFSKAKGYR